MAFSPERKLQPFLVAVIRPSKKNKNKRQEGRVIPLNFHLFFTVQISYEKTIPFQHQLQSMLFQNKQ